MAKKFVRSITGIKDINKQDLSTNNVGDLLSDGKDIYVHRKNGAKEEYFNLTSDKGDKYIADGDSGLEIWQKEGEDSKRIKLSQEFLKNNAQFISAEENSGLKATPRQDKYGKSYEIGFTDEAKAKIQDVVDKVNKIPSGSTGSGKTIKVKPAPTPINADDQVDVLTVDESADSVTLGLTNNVLTGYNLRGDKSTLGGEYITVEEITWRDMDENYMDVTRHGWGIHLNENFWASRMNMKTVKGSGILLKEETELAGLNLDTSDITFDIDSSKLVRHDCLLGDETKGIKVWHTDGESTSAISLTDDVWAKIQKIDSLSTGGSTKTQKIVGDGDTISVEDNLDGEKVIMLNSDLKTGINKAINVETRVTNVENKVNSMATDTTAPVSITSDNGSVAITKEGNHYDLAVDTTDLKTTVDNVVNNKLTAKLDDIHTLIEGTTVEAPLTKSYNQTDKGRTVNIALSESAKMKLEDPLFKTSSVDGVRYTIVGIPYSTYNYLATITIETAPIDSTSPITLAKTNEFAKWLSAMSFPSDGGYQSGTIILTKETSGAIKVTTAQDASATKCQGQFTAIISRL